MHDMQDPIDKFYVQKAVDEDKIVSIKNIIGGDTTKAHQSLLLSRRIKEDGVRFQLKVSTFCKENNPITVQLLLDGFVAQCCIRHVAHLGK